jgi:hypothetical protein
MAGEVSENFLNSSRNFGRYQIKTAEELEAKVSAYFKECDEHQQLVHITPNGDRIYELQPQPYTWTGLALAVGLSGRNAINNYFERDEFYPVLLAARLKIQAQWESKLQRLGNNNGVMFNLTNNTLKEEQFVNKTIVDQNLGGQPGNPVEVKQNIDDLPEEALEKIKELIDAHTKSGRD